jgi:hypothetical protein
MGRVKEVPARTVPTLTLFWHQSGLADWIDLGTEYSTPAQIGTNVRHQYWSLQLGEHRGVVTPMIGPAHTGIHLLGVLLAAFGGGWLSYYR